jgi:hypothetical protein
MVMGIGSATRPEPYKVATSDKVVELKKVVIERKVLPDYSVLLLEDKRNG